MENDVNLIDLNLRERIIAVHLLSSYGLPMQTIPEALGEVSKLATPLIDAEYNAKIKNGATFKSTSVSLKYLAEGTEDRNDLLRSHQLLDDCIANAPPSSQELALGYAHRSAVLFKMAKFKDCLTDIHRAKNYPYKYELLLREALCQRALNQRASQNTFRLALQAVQQSADLSQFEREILKTNIMEEQKKECILAREESYKVINPSEKFELSYGQNEEIPCVSSAIQLKFNEYFGRYLVATQHIQIGDTLIVESPFVVEPGDPEIGDVHSCSYCQNICFSLLPCPHCNWALFCNEECLLSALEEYHSIECDVVSKLIVLGEERIEPAMATIRCIAKIGRLSKNDQIPPQTNNRTSGFNSQGIYDSKDFETVLNLVSNFSKYSIEEQLDLCAISLMISKCLNSNIPAFIMHVLAGIRCNCIALKYPSNKRVDLGIGAAVYPAFSLLSHSCNPNSVPIFNGNQIVLKALLPIKIGSQITIAYTTPWPKNDQKSRQNKLKNDYKFDCECEACFNQWPSQLQNTSNPHLKLLFDSIPSIQDPIEIAISKVLTELSDKNETQNLEFVRSKSFLVYLFSKCGTVITGL